MKTSLYLILGLPILSLFFSCSGSKSALDKNITSSTDNKFKVTSIDLFIPEFRYELPAGPDRTMAENRINFFNQFIKYFPEGIKKYSFVNEVGVNLFKLDPNKNTVEYNFKNLDGSDNFIYLPEPIVTFANMSNSDFIFLIQYLQLYQNEFPKHGFDKKYITKVQMQYSVWDRSNLNLVSVDTISATAGEYKSDRNWPFRNAILNLADKIIDKFKTSNLK